MSISLNGSHYHDSEHGGRRICSLCARANDLADFELCTNCCYALAQAQEQKEEQDGFDNFIDGICRKLGVGTLPALMIIAEEAWLTHLMHHFVFLPTPVGYELMAFCSDVAKKMNVKCRTVHELIVKHYDDSRFLYLPLNRLLKSHPAKNNSR